MSRGKYQKKRKIPVLTWVLIGLAVLSMTFGGTVAYLSASAGPLTNQFEIEDSVNPVIQETVTGNVKSNVTVNVGETDYPVYVRAAVVVTWQKDGNVYWQAPVKGIDYAITMNETDWFKADDGYWYYRSPVASEGSTTALINTCAPAKAAPADGYVLSVEILAQTIQAVGTTDTGETPAVETVWPVTVGTDGKLAKATS